MIIADTSVWVDYFNGRVTPHTNLLDDLLAREWILIGDLIITELLQGFRDDNDFRRALRLIESLEFAPMLGRDVALKSAQNYRALRRLGTTVRKTIDVMIATFCIVNRHSLLHDDHDFDPVERHLGLTVIRP